MSSKLIILSGPSGVGKTTIGKKLLEDPQISVHVRKVPTYTTRPPRPGEVEGEDYIFVTKTEFAMELSSGNFLEWVEIFGNFYGTSRREIEKIWQKGLIPLLIIDVRGAKYIKSLYPDRTLSIFVMPPSEEELRKRLSQRPGITIEDLRLRLSIAHEEMAEAKEYDYIVVNDDLEKAVKRVKKIVQDFILSEKPFSPSSESG